MAIDDKRLIVSDFDFDDVKSNLKLFLEAQTEFTDYDFEGSGMNILLDVLAYNTHYLGFNANMLANEMFLDSSSLRSSIVSHAKTLGYTPTSARASKAVVDVTLNTNSSSLTMPAGTVFNTDVDGVSYNFSTITDVTKSNTGNSIPFLNTDIYEGTFITTRYTVDSSDIDQRFLLTDNRADTTTLTVKVQTSSSDSTTTTYTEATDITQVSASSNVYFLQEVEAGVFEIYFGDGVTGYKPINNNIVTLDYIFTNGKDANNAEIFTVDNIGGFSTVTVTTVSKAAGGVDSETTESIRFNAPLTFTSQNRAVTSDDYSAIMLKALADRLAESFAEYLHRRVRAEFWGYAADEALDNNQLIKEQYRGIRPAPGYPACPDHREKETLFRLLDVERNTGISLTESMAMTPTAAVSGFYFGHPDARYFNLGKISNDQLAAYSGARGESLEEAQRWLAPVLVE